MPDATPSYEINVVLVGAQYAGLAFLKTFLKTLGKTVPTDIAVTVIDTKDHFYHRIASPRVTVDPENWSKRVFITYEKLFGAHAASATPGQLKFVQGTVNGVQAQEKKLTVLKQDGQSETVSYDYLILATGISYAKPCQLENNVFKSATEEISQYAEKVKAAKSYLVIGGGPVGIEVAGDLATTFPDKKVTLIHNNERLLHSHQGLLPKYVDSIEKKLKEMKVEIIYEKMEIPKEFDPTTPKTLKTVKDREITTDFQFICTGAKLNTAFLVSLDDGKALNEKKAVKVNDKFQLIDHPDIFAIGDINDVDCFKLAYLAGLQGDHLAKGLAKGILAAKKASKSIKEVSAVTASLAAYKVPSSKAIFIVVGANRGSGQIGSTVIGDFFVRMMKGKSLFYQMYWGLLNQKPPK